MGDGYAVTPDDLDGAARGVRDVLDTLAEVGGDRAWADIGRGAGRIAAAAGPIGHDGLAEALDRFCTRWEWGVRAAVATGREMADGLAATARTYTDGDAAPAGLFGRIYADIAGRPSADPAADRTWEQLGADAARPETAQDGERAIASAGESWSATAQDVWTNALPATALPAQLEDADALWQGLTG